MNLSKDLDKFRAIYRNRKWEREVRSTGLPDFPAFLARWNRHEHWPIDVGFDGDTNTLEVRDTGADPATVHISRGSRVRLYKDGVRNRLDFLWQEYLADRVGVRSGDAVIDIGANVGEFSMTAARLGARTFSFEPDPDEFRSLQANRPNGECFNMALWHEAGTMTFYSKNDTGDSSLIEMDGYSRKIDVEVSTLDEMHRTRMGSCPIKLIKLEAEGAEPEILAAAQETLRYAEYVTADVGPERGFKQENTIVPVLNAMQAAGFELLEFASPRYVMLFRNARLA